MQAYLGDIRNNMTYDLMRGGALTGSYHRSPHQSTRARQLLIRHAVRCGAVRGWVGWRGLGVVMSQALRWPWLGRQVRCLSLQTAMDMPS